MKAILAGFGSSQLVSRDFRDCKEIGRTIKDILGKNVFQFGCVLSELMRNCYHSGESDEVRCLSQSGTLYPLSAPNPS